MMICCDCGYEAVGEEGRRRTSLDCSVGQGMARDGRIEALGDREGMGRCWAGMEKWIYLSGWTAVKRMKVVVWSGRLVESRMDLEQKRRQYWFKV